VRRIKAHVRSGGVVAYATESCFGLGCDPRNYRAIMRILRLKRRPKSKGLIVIASSFGQLSPYLAPLSAAERETVCSKWPGPHTWLISASDRVLPALRGRHQTLAVRVTAHPDARRLCDMLNMPLVSTSANRRRARPIKRFRECARQFGKHAMVIRGRIGNRKRPSTIQDLKSGDIRR